MAGLLNATAAPAATSMPGEWKQYNGQQVLVGPDVMKQRQDTVATYNKLTGGNMTAMEYDKQANPTSYGARWGIPESEMAKAPVGPAKATAAPANTASAPSIASYDPIKATSGTATTANATAVNAGSTGYTAAQVDLKPESSAAYQMNKITAEDSALNTSARSFADQQSNRRGLLNSSIAVGASQDAVLKNAMPLAQQDANTNFQANMADAASTNRAGEFTAGAKNTADLSSAQLGTDVSKYNAGSANDTSKFNVQQDAQISQFNASSGNTALGAKASASNAASLQDGQLRSQKELAAMQIASNQTLADKDRNTKVLLADKELQGSMDRMNLDAETRVKINGLDNESKVKLADVAAKNAVLLKNSESAGGVMQQAMVALASISSSTMDKAGKDAAALNILNTMKNSLDAIQNIDNLRLSQYWPTSDTPSQTTGPQPEVGTIDSRFRGPSHS